MPYLADKIWPNKVFENMDYGNVEKGRSIWFMLSKDNGDIVFEGNIMWEPDRSAPFEAYAEIEFEGNIMWEPDRSAPFEAYAEIE